MRKLTLSVVLAVVPVVASAEPRDADPQAAAVSADRDSYRVDAGVELVGRALTFNSRVFQQAPPAMRSSSPGLRVAGEAYPFANREPRSAFARFGIAGEYEQSLGLNMYTAAAPGQGLPVDQHRWSIGARYRYAFGDASMPTITLALDYTDRVFAVDRSTGMVDLPDVDYAAFEPGVDVRAPITPKIALLAGARLTVMQSAGDIASATQYGSGHMTGARAMTAIDVVLGRHYVLRLEGDVAVVDMAFYGDGMQANNRDGDPTTLDVGGATDRYWGGSATMAVFY